MIGAFSSETLPLRRIARVLMGDLRLPDAEDGEIPIWGANGVIGHGCSQNLTRRAILVGQRGTVGSLAIVTPPAWVTNNALVVEAHPGVSIDFIYYALTAAAQQLVGVSTAIPMLTQEMLRSVTVTIPTEERRQRSIADFLDTETARIDRLIEKKRRMVELLEKRRAEAVGRAVLGFASRDPSMPAQAWASALPTVWPIAPLGHCLMRVTYGFTNPMPTVDDGPYLLTANDIGDGAIQYSTARRTSEQAYLTEITDKSRPRAGDVLVTKDGSLGRIAQADGTRACINQSVALLRPSKLIDSQYLVAVLQSAPYQQLMAFQAGGTTIKHIYITRIVKMPIPRPPLDAQRQVACTNPS